MSTNKQHTLSLLWFIKQHAPELFAVVSQDLDVSLRLAAQRKINRYRRETEANCTADGMPSQHNQYPIWPGAGDTCRESPDSMGSRPRDCDDEDDNDVPGLVPVIPGGIRMHHDETCAWC